MQQTNPVTYLLEDSRGESIAGGFYEYELHSVANPDVHCWKGAVQKGKWGLREIVGIWQFAQFMNK